METRSIFTVRRLTQFLRQPAEGSNVHERRRIGTALGAGADVYCYFKHEGEGMSPRMAKTLEALVPSAA